LDKRTRATFLKAEFGFFGVVVKTLVQTPRLCGQLVSAGDFDFDFGAERDFRISWLIVGIETSCLLLSVNPATYPPLAGFVNRKEGPGHSSFHFYLGLKGLSAF
jgi:hypothetical protein